MCNNFPTFNLVGKIVFAQRKLLHIKKNYNKDLYILILQDTIFYKSLYFLVEMTLATSNCNRALSVECTTWGKWGICPALEGKKRRGKEKSDK